MSKAISKSITTSLKDVDPKKGTTALGQTVKTIIKKPTKGAAPSTIIADLDGQAYFSAVSTDPPKACNIL